MIHINMISVKCFLTSDNDTYMITIPQFLFLLMLLLQLEYRIGVQSWNQLTCFPSYHIQLVISCYFSIETSSLKFSHFILIFYAKTIISISYCNIFRVLYFTLWRENLNRNLVLIPMGGPHVNQKTNNPIQISTFLNCSQF